MANRASYAAAGALLLGVLASSSCGGRGVRLGGGSGGNGNLFQAGALTGTVRLDELTRGRGTHTYTIHTPIGMAPLGASGAYSVNGFVNSQTPALIVDETGAVRSFAFIDKSGTVVDNALVAKSLAVFAAKAYAFPPELRQVFWRNLGDAPEVDALRANLAALGGHLDGGSEAVRAAADTHIGALVQRLASEGRMRIEPPDGRSGVEVLQQGLNDIIGVNHYRRRAHAFVERIGVTFEGGATEPRQDPVAEFALDPISNPASLNALLADIGTMLGDGNSAFTGNIAWVPTQSEPLHLEVVPSNAIATKYRVVVVGPGRPSTVANFSPAMQEMMDKKISDTILLDFVVPTMMAAAGPLMQKTAGATDESLIRFTEWLTVTLKDFLSAAIAQPSIRAKFESGDFAGGAHDIVSLLMTSEATSTLRTEVFRRMILAFAPNADEEVVNQFLGKMGEFLLAADLVLQGADFAMIGAHIAQSKTAEEFVVDVTKARVKLNPPAATLSPLNEVSLHATVPDATGEEAPLITYRFTLSNPGAVMLKNPVNGQLGSEMGSSTGEMIVASQNHQTGTFTVVVEAIVDRPGTQDDVSLGTAETVVTVVNDKAVLRPAMASVRPGGTLTLECTINNPRPGAQYMLKWSCTNTAGSIPASGDLTSRRTAMYTAGSSTGADEVSVEVFQQGEGGLVRIGSAKSGIRVEDEPTILPATYHREVITPYVAGAFVTFAEPARPGSYRLVGVGGNDFAYFGSRIEISGGRRVLDFFGAPYDLGEGTLGFGLSAGSSANPANDYFGWFDARFSGFSFYVVVTR